MTCSVTAVAKFDPFVRQDDFAIAWILCHYLDRRIALKPGHESRPGLINLLPPAIVAVALIKDVGCIRFQSEVSGIDDIVHCR